MDEDIKIFIIDLICNIGKGRENLFDILWEIQKRENKIDKKSVEIVSQKMGIPYDDVKSAVGFYPFLSDKYLGDISIFLNKSSTSHLSDLQVVEEAFKREVGIEFGEVSVDKKFGLFYASCAELCEEKPVAVINNIIFTNLTDAKVASLISQLKLGISLKQIVENGSEFFQG